VSFILFAYKVCKYRFSKAHLCVLTVPLCIYRVFAFFRAIWLFLRVDLDFFWLCPPGNPDFQLLCNFFHHEYKRTSLHRTYAED